MYLAVTCYKYFIQNSSILKSNSTYHICLFSLYAMCMWCKSALQSVPPIHSWLILHVYQAKTVLLFPSFNSEIVSCFPVYICIYTYTQTLLNELHLAIRQCFYVNVLNPAAAPLYRHLSRMACGVAKLSAIWLTICLYIHTYLYVYLVSCISKEVRQRWSRAAGDRLYFVLWGWVAPIHI